MFCWLMARGGGGRNHLRSEKNHPGVRFAGPERTAPSYTVENSEWIFGKASFPEGEGTGTGCPGQCWSHRLGRDLKDVWMWPLGTWFSGGLGGAGLMI